MIALLLLIAAVVVIGGGVEVARRVRFGGRAAPPPPPRNDTLGHITSQGADQRSDIRPPRESTVLAHVRRVVEADPTLPRIEPQPVSRPVAIPAITGGPDFVGTVATPGDAPGRGPETEIEGVRLVLPDPATPDLDDELEALVDDGDREDDAGPEVDLDGDTEIDAAATTVPHDAELDKEGGRAETVVDPVDRDPVDRSPVDPDPAEPEDVLDAEAPADAEAQAEGEDEPDDDGIAEDADLSAGMLIVATTVELPDVSLAPAGDQSGALDEVAGADDHPDTDHPDTVVDGPESQPTPPAGPVGPGDLSGDEGFRIVVEDGRDVPLAPAVPGPAAPTRRSPGSAERTRAQLAALVRSGGVESVRGGGRSQRGGHGGTGARLSQYGSRRPGRHGRVRMAAATLGAAIVALAAISSAVIAGDHAGSSPHQGAAARPAPVAVPSPLTVPSPGVSLLSQTASTATYAVPSSATISFTPSASCWTQIRRGNETGAVTFEGILSPGQDKRLTGPVWVRLGNPPAMAIQVNGTPLHQPALTAGDPFNLQFR